MALAPSDGGGATTFEPRASVVDARALQPAAGPSAVRRILRNAVSILIGDAAGEVLTTYAIALAALHLGPRMFGQLSEAQGFFDPFDALAAFGLTPVALSMGVHRGAGDGALRGTVDGLRVILSLVAGFLALAVAAMTGRSALLPQLAVLAIGQGVAAYWASLLLPFQIDQRMERVLAIPFLASLVRLGTAYMAVAWLCTPVGFQLSGLCAGVATALLLFWTAHRYYPTHRTFDRQLARTLVRTAWPAAVEGILVMIYLRGAYLVLHGGDPVAAGEYAAADRLLRPSLGLAAILSVSALPTLTALAKAGEWRALRRGFARSAWRTMQIVGLIVAIAWPGSAWLLRHFAPEYVGAIWPFRMLLLGLPFIFVNQLARTYALGLGRYRAVLAVSALNLGVFGVLAFTLVRGHGALGAAIATLITEVVACGVFVVLTVFVLREERNVTSD